MEVLALLFGGLAFSCVAGGLLVLGVVKVLKPRTVGCGCLALVAIASLPAYAMARFMFWDEPLAAAAMDDDIATVRRLLDRGASPDADFEGNHALCSAAANGDEAMVKLLLDRGADINIVDDGTGWTAVKYARYSKFPKVVKLLEDAAKRKP